MLLLRHIIVAWRCKKARCPVRLDVRWLLYKETYWNVGLLLIFVVYTPYYSLISLYLIL